MSDKKQIRKNRYKKSKQGNGSGFKKRIFPRLSICLKTLFGIAMLGLLSLSLIFIHDLVTQCDYFRADNISISGTNRLSDQEIHTYAGIQKGVNILSVNLSLARTRLLEHPWIEDVEIRRELPTGISILVQEHSALAVLSMGRKFLINFKGEIFKEYEASDPQNLPIVAGLDYSDLSATGEIRSTPLAAVLKWLLLIEKSKNILPEIYIEQINVDREIGITLQLSGKIKSICLGYNDYSQKTSRLRRVVKYLRSKPQLKEIQSIDLINPDRVILRPVG